MALIWPEDKRVALSLSFDDARLSQIDNGMEILERHGAKATFYVIPETVELRLDGWRRAVDAGHEIGNHTLTHPCSANFPFARDKALEDYTLDRIEEEIVQANQAILDRLGVTPATFAYPCGQAFVGRGEGVRSYVPVVARRFAAGRGYFDEWHNDPERCDLAQLLGRNLDGLSSEDVIEMLDKAAEEGGWLVLAGHGIGAPGPQTVLADTLDAVCRHAMDPANGVWLDTVAAVAAHIAAARA